MKIFDYVIVGAGLCGLHLGDHLKNHYGKEILILEKSRGVGGRMATRRDDQCLFDHGVQIIQNDDLMNSLVLEWSQKNLLKEISSQTYSAIGGMTKLAKELASRVDLELERKVTKFTWQGEYWKIEDDQSRTWFAYHLINTAPLPQVLEILNLSALDYPKDLKKISYAKNIVFLLKSDRIREQNAYRELIDSPIFSVSSQKAKGTSQQDAVVVVMNHRWSEEQFNHTDEVIISRGYELLRREFSDLDLSELKLKKWRYAFAQNWYHRPYLSLANGLYLAGDGFSEGKINGAVKSAKFLITHLTSNNP